MLVKRNCLVCGSEFEAQTADIKRGHGKFCSTSCSAIYGNQLRSRPNTECKTCGKPLHRPPSHIRKNKTGFYCNRECKRIAETVEDSYAKQYKSNNRRKRLNEKQELLDKFGVVCQAKGCDLELHDDRALIDIHHFSPSDTTLLCPYHHRLADKGYLTRDALRS